MFDKKGNLWTGSFNDGAYKSDGKTVEKIGKVSSFQKTRDIYELKSGNIIISGNKGLRMWDGKNLSDFLPSSEETKLKGSVVFEDNQNNLWIGTFGQGLFIYDGKTVHHFSGSEGFEQKYIYSIIQYVNGDIWIGTGGGAYVYSHGIFKVIGTNEGLCNYFVGSIVQPCRERAENGITRDAINFLHLKSGSEIIIRSELAQGQGPILFGQMAISANNGWRTKGWSEEAGPGPYFSILKSHHIFAAQLFQQQQRQKAICWLR